MCYSVLVVSVGNGYAVNQELAMSSIHDMTNSTMGWAEINDQLDWFNPQDSSLEMRGIGGHDHAWCGWISIVVRDRDWV